MNEIKQCYFSLLFMWRGTTRHLNLSFQEKVSVTYLSEKSMKQMPRKSARFEYFSYIYISLVCLKLTAAVGLCRRLNTSTFFFATINKCETDQKQIEGQFLNECKPLIYLRNQLWRFERYLWRQRSHFALFTHKSVSEKKGEVPPTQLGLPLLC